VTSCLRLACKKIIFKHSVLISHKISYRSKKYVIKISKSCVILINKLIKAIKI
jgi:hypothetical protein